MYDPSEFIMDELRSDRFDDAQAWAEAVSRACDRAIDHTRADFAQWVGECIADMRAFRHALEDRVGYAIENAAARPETGHQVTHTHEEHIDGGIRP